MEKVKEDFENRVSEISPHGFWWSNVNLKVDALWSWIEEALSQAYEQGREDERKDRKKKMLETMNEWHKKEMTGLEKAPNLELPKPKTKRLINISRFKKLCKVVREAQAEEDEFRRTHEHLSEDGCE